MIERPAPTSDAAHPDPESERSTLSLLIRGIARGISVWLTYQVLLTFTSWVAFLFVFSDLWRGMGGIPAARAGGLGAVLTLVVLLAYPQMWVTLLYLVGFPGLGFLLGKKAGISTAVARVASGRVSAAASWLTAKALVACEPLSRMPGSVRVRDVTRALLAKIEPEGAGVVRRWFLTKLLTTLRVPELCAASSFLAQVREQPEKARAQMQQTLEGRLRELTEVSRFRALWIILTAIVVLTASHSLWVPLLRVLPTSS